MGEDGGVTFRNRGQREIQRWGEIADFDPTIFPAYVERPGAVESGVAFEFSGDRRTYSTSETIPLTVLFQPQANTVALERLARCLSDGRVIWETIDVDFVRGQTQTTFNERFFDAGPNANGDQFVRVRVYDEADELVGWSIDQIFLSDFEQGKIATASPKNCATWEF